MANPLVKAGGVSTVNFGAPVQDIDALAAVTSANRFDKQTRLVEDEGTLYHFDLESTASDADGPPPVSVDTDGIVTPDDDPAAGRWLKISSLIQDHGTLLGLQDDDHNTVYVRLAGRAGTTNNFTISTDGTGIMRGSAAAGGGLDVHATSSATDGPIRFFSDSATERMRLLSTGELAIGATSVLGTERLSVFGDVRLQGEYDILPSGDATGEVGTDALRFNRGRFVAVVTGGSSVVIGDNVRMGELAADPSAIANSGTLYTKEINSITEAFYVDSAGNVTRITSAGSGIPFAAYVNNGNSFGGLATLGTNDNFPLAFEVNNTEVMRVLTTGITVGTTGQVNSTDIISASGSANEVRSITLVNKAAGTSAQARFEALNDTPLGVRVGATSSSFTPVAGKSASEAYLEADNGLALLIRTVGDQAIKFQQNSTEAARIDGEGRFLIQTSQPIGTEVLSVNGDIRLYNDYDILPSGDSSGEIGTDALRFKRGRFVELITGSNSVRLNDSVILGEQASDPSAIANSGVMYAKEINGITELFFRDSSGNITRVTSAGSGVPFAAYVNNGNSFGGVGTLGTNDNFALAFETNGSEKMRLLSTGELAIGATSVLGTERLSVFGDVRLQGDYDILPSGDNSGEIGTDALRFKRGRFVELITGSNSVRLNDSVIFGEQASDPSAIANSGVMYAKEINGVTDLFFRDSAGSITKITSAGSGIHVGSFINGGNSFAGVATIGTNDNFALAFETNNTESFRVTTGSDIQLSGDFDIIPSASGTGELGTSAIKWGAVRANVLDTGDLNLRSNEGQWNIREQEDFIMATNLNTGKKYKLALEEIA